MERRQTDINIIVHIYLDGVIILVTCLAAAFSEQTSSWRPSGVHENLTIFLLLEEVTVTNSMMKYG